MTSRRDLVALGVLAFVVTGITAIGIGVRATYGARTTADEPQYLLSALSLWEEGDLDISDELSSDRFREFHEVDLPRQTVRLEDGRQISPHDPLLPLLLAVPVGLGGWIGAKTGLAVIAGIVAALMAWTAVTRFGVSRRVAIATSILFALSPPLAVYATQIYPALPAALALLGGFAAVTGPFGPKGKGVFLLSVVALPWLAVKLVPLAAALAIVGLMRADKRGRAGLVLVLAGAGVLYVLAHLYIYGGLTAYSTGDHFVGGEFTAIGTRVDLWGRSTRIIGLIVDRGFGIGAWQPAFLLLPLAAGWAVARRRREFDIAAVLLGMGWLMATFVALTMHGWWFPGRQVVVVLPLAIILIAAWVDRAARWKLVTAGLLGVLGVVAFAFLLIEGLGTDLTWVVDFATTSDPVYAWMSQVMPDYTTPSSATWILHGVWVGIAVILSWLGWRTGARRRGLHRLRSDARSIREQQPVDV